jgi:hypothetical protein
MFSSNTSQLSEDANYIESVFSTWLYTGNGSTQTITNGIDLAGKGGMVWAKVRSTTGSNIVRDSARGPNNALVTDDTFAQGGGYATTFTSTGYTDGTLITNGATFASWTFREQPKFFDVVTYTGDGTSGRTVAHNLGAVPGCMIVKKTNNTGQWCVYHRGLTTPATDVIFLNLTNAQTTDTNVWNSTAPTSTLFTLGNSTGVNNNGDTYVAYLFAHNAGGFGLTGTDNVISCGSYTGNGTTGNAVTLGYEPQFVMIKRADSTGNWFMQDVMRGIPNSGSSYYLYANTSEAETDGGVPTVIPTATGFTLPSSGGWNASGGTYIYIAIRRGPMKVPTTGTSVFTPVSTSGNVTSITSGFPVDFALGKEIKNSTSYGNYAIDRLRGGTVLLETNTTGVEYTSQTFKFDSNTQFLQSGGGVFYGPSIYWNFRRAPGFFDEVCYTGNGTQALTHNLGVVPEMFILKNRAGGTDGNWIVYHTAVGNTAALQLNLTAAPAASSVYFANTSPTSTAFTVGTNQSSSGGTYVAYLFATCPGVSKVGSYTGTGTTQQINCGFTAGSRFVLIKRTDSTGDWYVWDTARGIVSGNDPYLLLNSIAAEVTSTDYIDTLSAGFEISSTAPAAINANGGTFVFLAIA